MKAKAREPYVGLTKVEPPGLDGPISLCTFCQFAHRECECESRYIVCCHPIARRLPYYDTHAPMDGQDCWGFKPDVSVEVAADIVGIWLQGKWVDRDFVPLLKDRNGPKFTPCPCSWRKTANCALNRSSLFVDRWVCPVWIRSNK